ncbi:Uncharacterised protein [Delftia tsuruhatensis]|uniref:hypothetical protein n=1 Tax=Delftia tsuruhatensis TaxID=180282 RepID=UPI001E80D25E|nr:hypothetical protein [Delftia tsuruhatensis]CAB5695785.1 Uncharacterised protein [Delftia tsuruhatensis]CAC9678264.1 Uncharacterised protein [Delftia tsuruhatensis]
MKPIPDPGLAEEFRRHPCGQHSEALKRLLERFRSAPMPGKHVLVELAHFGPWQAARLGATRGAPVEPIEGAVFDRIEDAEWFVFKARWQQHFGQALAD